MNTIKKIMKVNVQKNIFFYFNYYFLIQYLFIYLCHFVPHLMHDLAASQKNRAIGSD